MTTTKQRKAIQGVAEAQDRLRRARQALESAEAHFDAQCRKAEAVVPIYMHRVRT